MTYADRIIGGQTTRLFILRGNRYINDVLNAKAIPFMRTYGQAISQQDNARSYVTRVTCGHLANANVNIMQWSSMSPGMNPLEHIWDELGRHVCRHYVPRNISELTNALVREWKKSPDPILRNSNEKTCRNSN